MLLADWLSRTASNRWRRISLVIAALLAVIGAGIAIAIYAVPRCCGAPAPDPDFAWLTKAMQDCDEVATEQQRALYFLIIPIAVKADEEPQWRTKSQNQIGNAILLNSDEALEGLKSRTLRLSAENYGFNVRDQKSVLYNWSSSTGVTRLTIPDAPAIETFNAQFQTRRGTSDTDWGNVFTRNAGNCYWVYAIISN